MEWSAIAQGAVSAVLASGVVAALIKSIVERRIDHHFDVHLKRYEAELKVPTEVATKFDKERVEDYKVLEQLIRKISRKCRNALEHGPEGDENARALKRLVDNFEDLLYEKTMTLRADRLYDDVHFYKGEIRRISRRLLDAHQNGDAATTADRLAQIGNKAAEVLDYGDETAVLLEDAVKASKALE